MLTDDQLVAICEAEIEYASKDGELATERANALDYYHGDITSKVPTPKDRSGVVTRDVLDTVESVLPSLMRIFVEAENAVEFIAESQEDEEQCKLETDAVRTIFYEQNDGFLVLYSFIKDALLSKTGIVKTWWDEPDWEREEYEGLDDIELEKLLAEDTYKYDVIESEQTEEGWNVVFKTQKKKGGVQCDVTAPEEFGISRDASSPNPKKATFCYHRVQKTASELIEEGFDKDIIDDLPSDEEVENQERLARRNLSDEQQTNNDNINKSMRKIWITECYMRVDQNDDGIAELLKVTLASVGGGAKLLDKEEVDRIPFSAAVPIILTHKFYGLSLADLVMDIQEIRSVLMRGILDNTYLSNNVRMGANENVNLDDLLTSRAGGVVRTTGRDNPGNHLFPIVHPPIPGEAFGLLEVLDGMIKNRTGVGDEVMGLDTNALANINTGVIAQAYDAARMRIELMARIIAEIGLKSLFMDIRELLHKHQDEAIQLKINNQWIDVNPSGWRKDRRCRVAVGLGHHTKERKLMAITDIMNMQKELYSSGYVTPEQIHNAVADRVRAHGLNVDAYFSDPATFQPPEKGPGPQEQIAMAQIEIEKERNQIEREKVRIDAQIKIESARSREREQAIRSQYENLKAEMDMQKMAINEQSQVMTANTAQMKAEFDARMQEREQSWKETMDALKLDLDKYKADLSADTTLEIHNGT